MTNTKLPVIQECDDVGRCTHKSRQKKPHTCPYKSDIHDDETTLCTCCTACQQECADDI